MSSEIGDAAGKVWTYLNDNGEVATSALVRKVGLSRDEAHRALGWLAREGKLQFDTANGVEKVRLR